jgi:hypothetical protein
VIHSIANLISGERKPEKTYYLLLELVSKKAFILPTYIIVDDEEAGTI